MNHMFKRVLSLIFLLGLITISTGFTNKFAVNVNQLGQQAQQYMVQFYLKFETDERLFTLTSWLNWVGDFAPNSNDVQAPFSQQKAMRQSLKNLSKSLYTKHRKAYHLIRKDLGHRKNSHILLYSHFYGPPPSFNLNIPSDTFQNPMDPILTSKDKELIHWLYNNLLSYLPAPELIQEFYQAANIHQIWLSHYQKEHMQVALKYRKKGKKVLHTTLNLLKLKPSYPISYRFDLMGWFGIGGQTIFSHQEQQFHIKIHPYLTEPDIYTHEIMRHELAHALLNGTVKKHKYLIKKPLAKMVKARIKFPYNVKEPLSIVEELIARSIQYIDIEVDLRDKVFLQSSVLYHHVLEQMQHFKHSNLTFEEFIPQLFRTLNAEKEINRWNRLTKKPPLKVKPPPKPAAPQPSVEESISKDREKESKADKPESTTETGTKDLMDDDKRPQDNKVSKKQEQLKGGGEAGAGADGRTGKLERRFIDHHPHYIDTLPSSDE